MHELFYLFSIRKESGFSLVVQSARASDQDIYICGLNIVGLNPDWVLNWETSVRYFKLNRLELNKYLFHCICVHKLLIKSSWNIYHKCKGAIATLRNQFQITNRLGYI